MGPGRREQRVFLGAFQALLRHVGVNVMRKFEHKPLDR